MLMYVATWPRLPVSTCSPPLPPCRAGSVNHHARILPVQVLQSAHQLMTAPSVTGVPHYFVTVLGTQSEERPAGISNQIPGAQDTETFFLALGQLVGAALLVQYGIQVAHLTGLTYIWHLLLLTI
jgi:hypothetical protein|eukprot:COSAG01_NODE_604_length_14894_cov_24.503211_14_plen_125_part_00